MRYQDVMIESLIKAYENGTTSKFLRLKKNPLWIAIDNPRQLRPEVYSKGLVDSLNKSLPYINFTCDVYDLFKNADLELDIDIRLIRIVTLIIQEAKIDSCYISTKLIKNGCLITFEYA